MRNEELDSFRDEHGVTAKGSLSVVVQLTRAFASDDLPIDPNRYKTGKEGQVKGLSGGNLKTILASRGITRTLSREGGRTSRGSMGLMNAYAGFVNRLYKRDGTVDFTAIEDYWISQVLRFFSAKPFKLTTDASRSLDSMIDDLIAQARKRESENPGTTYTGTVLQHLVAAKLRIIVPDVEVNGADVADAPTGREGDFMIGDTAIHCTTMPGQPLIEKCAGNVKAGRRPVIITIRERVTMARNLAEDAGIADRVEVWDIQQFLSTNIYEHGCFDMAQRRRMMSRIVVGYNSIIDDYESDPSLKIVVGD